MRYTNEDVLDTDGRRPGEIPVAGPLDRAWARAALRGVLRAESRQEANARYENMIEAARTSMLRTEAIIVIAQRFRRVGAVSYSEAAAVISACMDLRHEAFEAALDGPRIEGTARRADEASIDWEKAEKRLDRRGLRIDAEFLAARGERRLALMALRRPKRFDELCEAGLVGLLDGGLRSRAWEEPRLPRRRRDAA